MSRGIKHNIFTIVGKIIKFLNIFYKGNKIIQLKCKLVKKNFKKQKAAKTHGLIMRLQDTQKTE